MITHVRALLALAAAAVILLVTKVASASDEYKDVVVTEQVSAPTMVIAAYGAIWVLVVVYLVTIWQRQRRLEAEMAALRQQLQTPPSDKANGLQSTAKEL